MRALVLLSGGLDSTTCLAIAKSQNRECHTISFNYGQRHLIELESAKKIAAHYQVSHQIITIDNQAFASSALVYGADVPKNRDLHDQKIPSTYVPARNTLFLSYALGLAEVLGSDEIYFGANALDHEPYPDCRPTFFTAMQNISNCATKKGSEGNPTQLITPLLHLDKVAIVQLAKKLDAPIHLTFSCYDPTPSGTPCTTCDACTLRLAAFKM